MIDVLFELGRSFVVLGVGASILSLGVLIMSVVILFVREWF